ncbi:MAG: translation initiation factor [Calditrichaeota bacterium]|nr:MAG: translation initiation factor [Calditrichota bacterium]MBL1207629.1 translation initiation factor [Calditrichota bacterium]NOG47462.1 translation initiation factor [Calditrichota bacterium]
MKNRKNSQLVFSTHEDVKNTQEEGSVQNNTGNTAYIERDRKKRRGKVVTVISRLQGNLKELQKELQKDCGAGGSVKNGNIEIQGDHRDKIAAILKQKGFKIKFVGG